MSTHFQDNRKHMKPLSRKHLKSQMTIEPLDSGVPAVGSRRRRLLARDGNGDPIPDSPRGIPPLGDGDGEETSPAGI
jgi:hypothetical protein